MVCFMVFPFVVCVVLIVSGDGGATLKCCNSFTPFGIMTEV